MEEEKYIVALEIGSSKIKGAIGTVDSSGALSVKAVEEEKLIDGVRYGCIRNVLETTNAIRNVINRLEQREPQRKITGAYVSVGGRSLMAQDIEIERRLPSEMEITNELISDMTSEALNYQFHERAIVDVTPKEFRVDNLPTNRAVGMFGSSVSARLNLISCRNQLMRNLNVVFEDRLHLPIKDFFVRPLIEADLVLYPEEKRKGCMLVDFGAETTTVAIYKNGVLQYLSTIPMGSRNISRDITALNYLEERAEELKIQGGNALNTPEPTAADPAGVDFNQVNNYVFARAGEIIANINEQIKYAGLTADKLPAGIILIGRGAKLAGFDSRLGNLTAMKVRFGSPVNRLRIIDGRVNATDHVDVISILAGAARSHNLQECMERYTPEYNYASPSQPLQQPAAQPQANPYTAPEPVRPAAAAPQQHAGYQSPYQPQGQPYAQPYQPQQPAYQQPQQVPQPQQPAYQQPQQAPQPQQPAYQQPQQTVANNPYKAQADNITVQTAPESTSQEEQAQQSYTGTKKPGGFTRAWDALRNRVVSLMTEPVDDEDNDNDN